MLSVVAVIASVVLPRVFVTWLDPDGTRERSGGCWGWLTLLLLLPGLVLDRSGVVCLLFVLFWCGVCSWRLYRRWPVLCVAPVLCGVGLVMAHGRGHKLYGSAVVVDNRPLLGQPLTVERFEYPNLVVATDGSRHAVGGVVLRRDLLQRMRPEELRRVYLEQQRGTLRFAADAGFPSGYAGEWRIGYFCGNSFFPRPLPPPLPEYEKEDLAVVLRRLMLTEERWTMRE